MPVAACWLDAQQPPPHLPTLHDRAHDVLRTRAVLHEGHRRDELARRSRKHQPLTLTLEQARRCPRLAAHLTAHDGWPPSITRSSAARLLDLNALHAVHGSLVLLTVNLDVLDDLPLKSSAVGTLARSMTACFLEELAQPGVPYTAAAQRGEHGGTHAHLTPPLTHLHPKHAALVLATRPGPGGGCDLLDGQAHGVLIRNSLRDRRKVAAYLSRDPEGRLDLPGTDAYLDALEEELERKAHGHRSPRLSWSSGVLALRRSASSE